LADSIRPEAAEQRPLVKPTPAEIADIEDAPTMSEETFLKIQGESETPATPRPTILSQATPKMTVEARQNKIEGNVVLSVEFRADGTIGRIWIVRSLGFGLDENAVSAARQIRFRPAMSNGKPVTTRKRIEYKFRLL
jgi:TonB family protein